MLNLKNVTLVSINGVDPIYPLKALKYSSKDINFGEIILFSFKKPDDVPDKINFIKIPKFTYGDYSNFVLGGLVNYIKTDYVLLVQDDGFVLNSDKWNNEFYNYDYIGAPWRNIPHYQGVRVGNGGFTFRSKKFLNLTKQLPMTGFNEDHICCITYRQPLINAGVKYAPVEVAMKFSLEFPIEECEFNLDNVFGFHGNKDVGTYDLKNKLLDDA